MHKIWHKIGWLPATIIGSAIFALGFAFFLQPNDMNAGGISGLAMVAVELLGFGSTGTLSILINLPLFVLSWYVLSAIFGSHGNHYFLAHPARGFISFFEEFDPFIVAVFMWLTQLIVLLVVRGIISIIKKILHRKDSVK